MTITITAFADSPDEGAGLARDMIVRWALEEVRQPSATRLVPWADFKKPEHEAHDVREQKGERQRHDHREDDADVFECAHCAARNTVCAVRTEAVQRSKRSRRCSVGAGALGAADSVWLIG